MAMRVYKTLSFQSQRDEQKSQILRAGERKKSRSARVLLDSAIRERECAAAKYVRRCAYVYVYCITVERSKESIKRM